MSDIDLGLRTLKGGYFLKREDAPQRTPFVSQHAGQVKGYRHCLTYAGGGSTIREELIHLIDSAKRRVFVATLFLGDEDIRHALERAAGRLEGGVYVVSALDDRGLNRAINDASDTMDIDTQIEYRNFTRLTTSGIYVRGYPGLHAKFVVVDDARALVSSANLVTRSFNTVAENGLVFEDVEEVAVLAWVFRRLWRHSAWDMPPAPTHHSVHDRIPDDDALPDSHHGSRILWTWQEQHRILDSIRRTIEQAVEELVLATFSIGNMTFGLPKQPARPELLYEPVCRALGRGVRVRMLLRGRNISEASRAEASAFQKAGVEIYADRLSHAKGCIADGRTGSVFSANLMTAMGLTGGMELGTQLDGTGAVEDAWHYFQHCMTESDLEFKVDPPARAAANRLLADSLHRWPRAPQGVVTCSDQTWIQLSSHTGPALFQQDGEGFLIFSGSRRYRLSGDWERWLIEPASGLPRHQASGHLLERWISPRRGESPPTKDVCGIFAPLISREITA